MRGSGSLDRGPIGDLAGRSRRAERWRSLPGPWDVLVVGGGITGAGILRAAARSGLRACLVERGDFACGTSSRSSKLVHGGLRYLASGQPLLTFQSVRERERLVTDLPGLVERIGFLLPTYRGDHPGRVTYEAGLTAYDLLAAGRTRHRFYRRPAFELLAPHLRRDGLLGGFHYGDAETDDARLTMRVVLEADAAGGTAVNYAEAIDLLRDGAGNVAGAVIRDVETGATAEARARVVINATGAWADRLRVRLGEPERIRPLRGSHLIFPAWRLPVAQAVSFLHPADRRPVFAIPWEGVTLYGTTDVDTPLDREQAISAAEADYLVAGLAHAFPSLDLGLGDAIATIAGVRPVIGTGKADPSKESRDHVIWSESGLLTVTGGKLTTFGLIARDALGAIGRRLGTDGYVAAPRDPTEAMGSAAAEAAIETLRSLEGGVARRLAGRYGAAAAQLVAAAGPGELEAVPGTMTLWAELRWAARSEAAVHLDDLLLRRTRLGILLPDGAAECHGRVRSLVQGELGWDDARWAAEEARYREVWRREHGVERRP